MKKRKVTDEQLILLDKLIKDGKSNDEIYPLVGIKFSSLLMWKRRLADEGLDNLLNKYSNERDIVVQRMGELEIGEGVYIGDDSGLNALSLITTMYKQGRAFSKSRESEGYRLIRRR